MVIRLLFAHWLLHGSVCIVRLPADKRNLHRGALGGGPAAGYDAHLLLEDLILELLQLVQLCELELLLQHHLRVGRVGG